MRYSCPKCAKRFSNTTTRRNHIDSVHDDNKKFKCPFCNMKFLTKFNLTRHQQHIHNVTRFHCESCPKKCKTQEKLDAHRDNCTWRPRMCKYCHVVIKEGMPTWQHYCPKADREKVYYGLQKEQGMASALKEQLQTPSWFQSEHFSMDKSQYQQQWNGWGDWQNFTAPAPQFPGFQGGNLNLNLNFDLYPNSSYSFPNNPSNFGNFNFNLNFPPIPPPLPPFSTPKNPDNQIFEEFFPNYGGQKLNGAGDSTIPSGEAAISSSSCSELLEFDDLDLIPWWERDDVSGIEIIKRTEENDNNVAIFVENNVDFEYKDGSPDDLDLTGLLD